MSKYQSSRGINYAELKKSGIGFAMLRAGFGKYPSQKDPEFENHYAACRRAGLACGAYHYSYALSKADAISEADCFLKWIAGKKLEFPVAFDMEDDSQLQLSTEKRTEIALEFMQKVQNEGYYTMLYSSPGWLTYCLDAKALAAFDLWLACYTSLEVRNRLYKGVPGIWQTRQVLLPKVSKSHIDENIAYKNYPAIIRRAGLNNL